MLGWEGFSLEMRIYIYISTYKYIIYIHITYIHVYVDYRDIQYNIMFTYLYIYTTKLILTKHSFLMLNDSGFMLFGS